MRCLDDLLRLASRQHGLLTRQQSCAHGLSRRDLDSLVGRGVLICLSRRVLRLAGSRTTTEQRWMAAVLDVGRGSVLSHGSAAALWGLHRSPRDAVHVTVERDGRQTQTCLATSHRPRVLPPRFLTTLGDIPVVRPELLVLQMCATEPWRAERVLDGLWSLRLLSSGSLARCLEDLARSGRTGITLLRELIDARGPGYVPPDSALEARFRSIIERACLPRMERQVELGDGQRWVGRVDFYERSTRHIVEVDSERYHAALSDRRSDWARQQALEHAGFTVTRVTDVEVWHHPDEVVRRVEQGRRIARAAAPRGSGLDRRRVSDADPTQNARCDGW